MARTRRNQGTFQIYDRESPDFSTLNGFDDELIQISSPPIYVWKFNFRKTLENGNDKTIYDTVYGEIDKYNDEELVYRLNEGIIDDTVYDDTNYSGLRYFDEPIVVPGYYQEATWTQELSRLGITNLQEEVPITFNHQTMFSLLGREITKFDVVGTMTSKTRKKLYKVDSAYVADEIIGWRYLHYHVIGTLIGATDLDSYNLPQFDDLESLYMGD